MEAHLLGAALSAVLALLLLGAPVTPASPSGVTSASPQTRVASPQASAASAVTSAASPTAPGQLSAPPPAAAAVWSDGTRTHPLWSDGERVAELAPDAAGEAAVRTAAPEATLERDGAVRLWRVKSAAVTLAALERRLPGRFTAVFRDGAATRSGLRVAKGGVAVFLTPAASADVERWAERAGVTVSRALSAAVVLVDSPPGDAALRLAAQLARAEGVTAATPDWWHPGVPR